MANLELENLHSTFNNFAFDLDERKIRMIEGNYKMRNFSVLYTPVAQSLKVRISSEIL